MSKFTESLGNVITEDYKHANIVIRMANVNDTDVTAADLKRFLRDLRAFIDANPYEGISVEISGVDLIYVSLIDYLVRSQLISILLSLIIVFIIIAITFKSMVFGFFGLIPIFFGLFLNFGTMSYFNVSLDFITSMIASIAVGLGVDNSIHYLIRFTRTNHTLPLKERLREALGITGTPIFFTSFTLIAGFCVLLFSSFKPILYFGLLISVTMLGCFIGVIFILPAVIYFVKPKAIIRGDAE
jgi:predicted RND superfamily exporter protein